MMRSLRTPLNKTFPALHLSDVITLNTEREVNDMLRAENDLLRAENAAMRGLVDDAERVRALLGEMAKEHK